MNSKTVYSTGSKGLSLGSIITIIFVIAKLAGAVTWPWLSANPFTMSVLMFFITWPVFIFLVVIGIYVVGSLIALLVAGLIAIFNG